MGTFTSVGTVAYGEGVLFITTPSERQLHCTRSVPDRPTTSRWSPDEAPTADSGSGIHSHWPSRQHRGTIRASDRLMWSGHQTVRNYTAIRRRGPLLQSEAWSCIQSSPHGHTYTVDHLSLQPLCSENTTVKFKKPWNIHTVKHAFRDSHVARLKAKPMLWTLDCQGPISNCTQAITHPQHILLWMRHTLWQQEHHWPDAYQLDSGDYTS